MYKKEIKEPQSTVLYCIPLDNLYTLSCLSLSGGWQRLRSNGQLISLGEQGCIPSAATDLVHKFRNDILLHSASGWIHSLGTNVADVSRTWVF